MHIFIPRWVYSRHNRSFNANRAEEYLEAAKNQGLPDKSNGFYKRNYWSLLKNHLQINIPRTRGGNSSPATIELVKAINEQVQDLVLGLYKKVMTSRKHKQEMNQDLKHVFDNFAEESFKEKA